MPDHALVPAPPPAPRHPLGRYRVSLVCLGNICRSPTAEVVLRAELARAGLSGKVEVDSSGTGDWHLGRPMDPGARAELAARGYDGSAHRARQFNRSWFGGYDLVLALDRHNLADLRRMAPDPDTARDRIRLLRSFDPKLAAGGPAGPYDADRYGGDVPDPYYGSPADYALAFDLVQAAASGLAAQLAVLVGGAADGLARGTADGLARGTADGGGQHGGGQRGRAADGTAGR
jgi:protein-tyrosine phosphatase